MLILISYKIFLLLGKYSNKPVYFSIGGIIYLFEQKLLDTIF